VILSSADRKLRLGWESGPVWAAAPIAKTAKAHKKAKTLFIFAEK
jgi:hypothetical protein